ncbi:MAG: sigma-E processing peptidase SpoIIGA [Bacillota bacterium]
MVLSNMFYIILSVLSISYIISYITCTVVRADTSAINLVLSSLILTAFILNFNSIIRIKFVVCLTVLFVSSVIIIGEFKLKKIILTTAVYGFVIFVIVGVFAVFYAILNDIRYTSLAVVGAVVVLRALIFFLYKNRHSTTYIYKIVAFNGDKIIECKGYFDSGNKLVDTAGNGMVVVSAKLNSDLLLEECGTTRVGTVAGVQELQRVKISFKIYFKGNKNRIYHTYAVVSDTLTNGEYDIILHRDMGDNDD